MKQSGIKSFLKPRSPFEVKCPAAQALLDLDPMQVDGIDEADVGTYDLAVGADVCYDPASVPPLLRLVTTLRARVTILIGPSTRPSLGTLGEALARVEGVTVEERQLSLVSTDAEAVVGSAESVPATVHRVLIVWQGADPACAAADG